MNSENSKSSKAHGIILKLSDKLDLRRGEKSIALSNLSIYYAWKKIKISCNNNEFEILIPTWNDKFKLPDGSYSVSDIQDYFLSIFWKNEKIDNSSIKIFVNKMENRITLKIKSGLNIELLTPETMKLLGSTENKDKYGANVPHLEINEVVLVHCNIFNKDFHQDSRVLYAFVPNKPLGKLLEITTKNFIPLKTFNSEFQTIEVWFRDQNSQPLEIEDRINLALVIK